MDHYQSAQNARFDQLLRPHMERLYRLAYRLAGDKAEAEDLFQDVLTKIYVRLDELTGLDEPGTWLNGVLYNHFIDNRRRYSRRRLVMVEENQLPGNSIDTLAGTTVTNGPEHAAERSDQLACLSRALGELSDEHRRLILLHDVEAYKLIEIQSFTNEPIGTLKSRLHRARARLRDLLAQDGTFFKRRSCNR